MWRAAFGSTDQRTGNIAQKRELERRIRLADRYEYRLPRLMARINDETSTASSKRTISRTISSGRINIWLTGPRKAIDFKRSHLVIDIMIVAWR